MTRSTTSTTRRLQSMELGADMLETLVACHAPVQKSPGDGLVLTRGQWSWDLQDEDHYQFIGRMEFHNITQKFEIFVPEVHGKLQLLASTSLESISTSIKILPRHPDTKQEPWNDGYWRAYIIRAAGSTLIEVSVYIFSKEGKPLMELQHYC